MQRIIGTVLAVLVVSGVAAAAQSPVMGTYEGEFTSGPWKGNPVKVQVVPQGKDLHKAVFPFEDPKVRVVVKGKATGAQGTFAGDVNLGGDAGEFAVTADLKGIIIKGTFKGKRNDSAFKATKVDRVSPTLGAKPPEGAVVLMDGSNLDAWERSPLKWLLLDDGSTRVCGSSFVTRQEFGDGLYHVEFRTPYMDTARDQGRGNSGVYVQGRYEVQVLDSFGEEPADNLCGGIYKIAVPVADACLPPTQWQTYDIEFTAPRFDGSGKKTKNAIITVRHNGVVVHDHVELPTFTGGPVQSNEVPKGPIMLQDHGNPVDYRNFWVVPK